MADEIPEDGPLTLDQAYAVLEVSDEHKGNLDKVKMAYRKLCLRWHPDKNPGDAQAEKVYSRMLAAYNTLMDPEARRVHDPALQAKKAQQAAATPTDGGTPGPTPYGMSTDMYRPVPPVAGRLAFWRK